MKASKKPTSDAVEILHRRYVRGRPAMKKLMARERLNAAVACSLHDLRSQHGLSQRQLAERVGTTASVICRLEDADYQGHSLTMLQRIAAALDMKLEVRFVPALVAKAKTRRREPA